MKSVIRVLHIMPNYSIGGINRYVMDLCTALNECDGIQADIFVLNGETGPWKELVARKTSNVYEGNFRPMDIRFSRIKAFSEIKAKYDIVNWHIPFPTLMMTCIGDSKCHVYTHHSILGAGRKQSALAPLKWKLFKIIINTVFDAQVFNSNFTRKFWKSRGLYTREEELVYNPIVPLMPSEESGGLLEKWPQLGTKFVVGTACSMVGCKRLNLLIDACAEFFCYDSEAVLLLVGDGPERERLEVKVREKNIQDKVIFSGFQPEVVDFIQVMDVFVSTSVGETFGLAVGEAMSLGKPAICFSDGGGVCEVVGSESGNIVSDSLALAERLAYYSELKRRQGSCESAAYEDRVKIFSMQMVVEKYIELYEKLINCA